METSCHIDGTLFPFDSQSCSVVIQSWAYSEEYVDLVNGSSHVHLENFNDDGIARVLQYILIIFALIVICPSLLVPLSTQL